MSAPFQPASAQPASAQPASAQPASAQPASAQPAPSQPAPSAPEPSAPEPAAPEPLQPLLQHATAVVLAGRGVLLLGPPGCGKSDLALRLIDRGAKLLSDDYVRLQAEDGRLVATAPPTIAGRLEVRGLGILPCEHVPRAEIVLAVGLGAEPPRLPDPERAIFCDIAVAILALDSRHVSAPLKVELALRQLARENHAGGQTMSATR